MNSKVPTAVFVKSIVFGDLARLMVVIPCFSRYHSHFDESGHQSFNYIIFFMYIYCLILFIGTLLLYEVFCVEEISLILYLSVNL